MKTVPGASRHHSSATTSTTAKIFLTSKTASVRTVFLICVLLSYNDSSVVFRIIFFSPKSLAFIHHFYHKKYFREKNIAIKIIVGPFRFCQFLGCRTVPFVGRKTIDLYPL